MKTKIVEFIALEIWDKVQSALGEIEEMKDKYPSHLSNTKSGMGLDMQVLKEHLKDAEKLVNLLTKDDLLEENE